MKSMKERLWKVTELIVSTYANWNSRGGGENGTMIIFKDIRAQNFPTLIKDSTVYPNRANKKKYTYFV